MAFEIHPQWLKGNWRGGWALDMHTVSSVRLPNGGFETKRTPIGEALYQLKYRCDRSKVEPIAETAANFLKTRRIFPCLKAIIPIPPSNLTRSFQPVELMARGLGEKTNLPVLLGFLLKVKSIEPLKSIDDPISRKQQLQGAFRVRDRSLNGKSILLFDDIYRSGETLREATRVLYDEGQVGRVYVLVITKTRRRR